MATRKDPDKKELVVFIVRRDTECGQCGEELGSGRWITIVDDQALCMTCAELDHLVCLPRGNAALTRRTRRYSRTSPVVVQWSRTRKQYERQGILAEREAIERAEQECLADEDARQRKRERRRERERELDVGYTREFARRIRERYPGCPKAEAQAIAEHTCRRRSGRVGRSAAAKGFDPEAIDLAVKAAVGHRHTNYDELLFRLWDRGDARREVEGQVDDVLVKWSCCPVRDAGQ